MPPITCIGGYKYNNDVRLSGEYRYVKTSGKKYVFFEICCISFSGFFMCLFQCLFCDIMLKIIVYIIKTVE